MAATVVTSACILPPKSNLFLRDRSMPTASSSVLSISSPSPLMPSFYRLIPKAVVLAKNEEEIAQLFHFSQREGIPMTFRAAGSSLSG